MLEKSHYNYTISLSGTEMVMPPIFGSIAYIFKIVGDDFKSELRYSYTT